MQRQLGQFEQAFALTNQAYGLVVVGVLRLRQGPRLDVLRRVLARMQDRHPLLRVSIEPGKKTFVFVTMTPVSPIPLEVVEREDDDHWQAVAQQTLNQRFEPGQGPLMRCVYLMPKAPATSTDLICAFHHAIVDGPSLARLYHELLSGCAALQGGEATDPRPWTPLAVQPPTDALVPSAYRGMGLVRRIIPFLLRQVGEERRYRKQSRHGPQPPLHPESDCCILSLTLSKPATEALVRKTRQERVTMNSVLAAAMLVAVYRRRYAPKALFLRPLVFSNLRPYLRPSLSNEHLGCYLSMLRFSVPVSDHDTLWSVARAINEDVYTSNKRGDKYLAVLMSKRVMQRLFRKKDERMATTALSYVGPLSLSPAYGTIEVTDVHAFITTNRLSPEYSAFGHLCLGRLRLDLMYMTADMDAQQAHAIAEEIEQVLQR